ncbi:putative methyltransferase NSUN5 [Aphelenchoides besseyi]|nr:putative methyltransferase NSUN5 [Aphelenchoides besseyi]
MSEKERPIRDNGFGQRYLENEADVFSFNAFDNVDWPDSVVAEFEGIIENQRNSSVSDEKAQELRESAGQKWEDFYNRHQTNFFMDRKWLVREFAEVFKPNDNKEPIRILEVGCGVGNSVFPMLEMSPDLFVYCCDFSSSAIEMVKQNPKFDSNRCLPFVWDITSDSTVPIEPNSLDHILCVFVLSAIPPEKLVQALRNLTGLLKKDGCLFVKDYGRLDLTQIRFKKQRYIQENLYARGDGTLVYFFAEDELHELLTSVGLRKEELFTDKRLINKKQLLRLSCETLKYRQFLEKLLSSSSLSLHLSKCRLLRENAELCLVVLYEMVIGRTLKAKNSAIRQFSRVARSSIQAEIELLSSKNITYDSMALQSQSNLLPRYCRVNTLKTTKNEVFKRLKDCGYKLIENNKIRSRKSFKMAIEMMDIRDYFVDRHLNELLVFHSRADLHDLDLVLDHSLILQDKASCLPALLLNPLPGSMVVDCCAAPGNKTTHLAAIMENQGCIRAFDRDRKRSETLEKRVQSCGAEIVTVTNSDFLKQDTAGPDFSNVQFALVDPPCSGSGMAKRNDFLADDRDDKRVSGLANLQSMILKHALRMPKLQRLVYSTCSIHDAENENVVAEVMSEDWISERFELINPLPYWKHNGNGEYEFSSKCLRADPETDFTNGFFIVVFQAKA